MGHPTLPELAAFVDRTLPAVELDRLMSHLALCPPCREEVVQATRITRGAPERPPAAASGPSSVAPASRSSISRRTKGAFALVAAAAAIVILLPRERPPTSEASPYRVGPEGVGASEGYGVLAAREPAEVVTAGPDPLRFVWASAPGEPAYRLTLQDAEGAPVWAATTRDTVEVLPSSVVLEPGALYFWTVDAVLADGSAASTGVRRVRVAR